MAEATAKGFISLLVDQEAVKKDITALPDKLQGVFGKFGQSIGGSLGGSIGGALDKALGSVTKGFGGQGGIMAPLALGVAAGGVAIGAALFEVGRTFDKTYKAIQKQTGATGQELKDLETSFKNVAKNTGASFESIGDAVAGVYQRTGATGQALEDLSLAMLRMSSVTGKDLNTVIERSTSLFNQWGIPVENMPVALDKLYVASAKTGIGVDELAASAEKMGPTMRQFGFGFDQSVALLASFDKAGINSGKVGAALNTALGKLAKSGATDLPAALNESIKAIQGAGSAAEANRMAIELFGARAGPQMAEAIRSGAFGVDELTAALGNADGALKSTASETATFSGKMGKLKNQLMVALEPLAMTVFDTITNALMAVMPWVTKFIDFLGWMVKNIPGVKYVIVGLIAGIVALGVALGAGVVVTKLAALSIGQYTVGQIAAAAASKLYAAAQWLVNAAMSANPIALVIIAIVALVAAFVLLYTKCDWFRKAVQAVWEALKTGVMAVKDAFVVAFEWIQSAISAVWDWVSDNWPLLLAILTGPIGLAVAAIITYWDDVKGVIDKVIGWFTATPGEIVRALGSFAGMIVKWAEDAWAACFGAVKTAVNAIGDWLSKNWKELLIRALIGAFTGPAGIVLMIVTSFDPVKDFFTKTLPGWFKDVGKTIIGAFDGVKDFLLHAMPGWLREIPKMLGSAFAGLGGMIMPDLSGLQDLPRTVSRLITDVVNTIKQLPNQMVGALSGMSSTVSNIVKNALSSVTNVLGGLGGSISGALKGLPQQITGALGGLNGVLQQMGSQMIGALSNGMRDASKWVTDVVKAIPGAVKGAIGDAGSWLFDAGRKAIGGLTNGIRGALSWIGDAIGQVKGKVQGAVSGAINWLFGAGQKVVGGLANGIRGVLSWAGDAVRGVGGMVQGALGGAGGWLVGAGRSIISGLTNGIRAAVGTVRGAVGGVYGAAKAALAGAFGWLHSSGRAIIQGLINGIHSMVGAVRNAINSVLNAARRLLPFSPAKEGPFSGTGAPEYSGRAIAGELAKGIAEATPLVLAAAREMAEAAAHTIDLSGISAGMTGELAGVGAGGAGPTYTLEMHVAEADTSQLQAGFRRLELLSGAA